MIIAYCERCAGIWRVRKDRNPMTLEGACMECQDDSDTEKPLAFGLLFTDADIHQDLPDQWLADA